MSASLRVFTRWVLSTLIVSFPLAWLLWQWQWQSDKVLTGMSYQAFHAQLSDKPPPTLWTYAPWIALVTGAVLLATHMVNALLGKVFPIQVVKTR